MAVHRIKKGLDLPISGDPVQRIESGAEVGRVALLGDDTAGVRARLAVAEGDTVQRGQLIFEDRTRPGVRYTAPGAGRVQAIFRGARRVLRSVVIELSASERAGTPTADELATFESHPGGDPLTWNGDQVRALMVESGLWTTLRERPFGKVPLPEASPDAIFVTAIDTNPHAPTPDVVFDEGREDFQLGLRLIDQLTDSAPFLCIGEGSEIRGGVDSPAHVETFVGPHPAGTPGLHIHLLAPVSRAHTAWHVGYADVIDLGRLARTGVLPVERVVSLAGPPVLQPRLLRTRLGANLDELTHGEIDESEGEVRIISGSVLSGKKAMGPEFGYLGRYHLQVSALRQGGRKFLGWIEPGFQKFSILNVFLSKLIPGRKFDFDTDTNGSHRPVFPLNTYEMVMPMDIIPTYLLRALMVGDIEQAVALGALELDEEDLALCTYVCPGKTDFGPYLRTNLERIEKEG
ncbi:MAG: Na(+)-translocating NADH-quinone reductase subunit A [Myxococcales bacterium]|nr:Na(+)-translocating NADH-quinone reductase subunit A [Myxococcales bacterium]